MCQRLVLLAFALLLATQALAAEPTVILISFDGTRPAAAESLPVFRRIAAEGAWADGMIPAFPSNTFPNHVTLVTGVAPDRHGIVNNTFVDPARGKYDYTGDPTWLEVEPLWSLLARAGIPSASYHWVGSEGAWRNGLGPKFWKPFDPAVGERAKVDQILAWLDLPDPPRFVTSWFRGADGASHRFGPASAITAEQLARQADDLAALLDGLGARHLLESTTVVVVSDHGMVETSRSVDLAAALAEHGVPADVIVGGGGYAQVSVARPAERDAQIAKAIETAHALGLEAWPRGATPPAYATANPRFGDVVVVAPLGVAIEARQGLRWWLSLVGLDLVGMRGIHGHRPELPEMAALFGAIGRGVAAGARPGTVRAVDVAPTVLALLGQPIPTWMEGHAIPLDAPAPTNDPR